ncbi:hypothetical protein DH2020_013641 [Rehmannia glutinosa]|uniref:DUF599 domain-containing protein n=1 Tax=Rehmannia glutinosa TaxID=99300 RepID=A0ABR0X5Z0_REHGL
MIMEEKQLDLVLVPLGLGVLLAYHIWLLFTIRRNPSRTVIGLNAESRRKWVFCLMATPKIGLDHTTGLVASCSHKISEISLQLGRLHLRFKLSFRNREASVFRNLVSERKEVIRELDDLDDPLKNGVLAIQTIRNNIMASTLLATTAITLSSLISVYVSNKSSSSSVLEYGDKTSVMSSVKFFAILVCFLVAFLCNLLCIRYYAHTSFLVTVPAFQNRKDAIEYVATNLNRGGFFWSLGLRAFYLSFPLFFWVFGPISMFVCCCVMSFVLYFLDTCTDFTRDLHDHSVNGEDVEAIAPLA